MRVSRVLLLLGLCGCSWSPSSARWDDQLEPSGPCWSVNLADGLDEASPAEVHALYQCLNQNGGIAPLSDLDTALDAENRNGEPAGVDVARLANGLSDAKLDPMAILQVLLDLLAADDAPLQTLFEIAVEFVYGQPYDDVLAATDLASQASLDSGVLVPLFSMAPDVASAVLDGGSAIPDLLEAALDEPSATDLACSFTALAHAEDPDLQSLSAGLLPDLGSAIVQARSPENDRWSDASGDSLQDLTTALWWGTGGGRPLDALTAPVSEMLEDDSLVTRLGDVVLDAEEDGHLGPLPLQLTWLTGVDPEGSTLGTGEDSALLALMRLLSQANQEVDCSLDLWITSLDISLGNLSQEILRTLAAQDPDSVGDGLDLLSAIIGAPISQWILESVADAGICPAIDGQLVADLVAIDRLGDPEVGDLTPVLVTLLAAFEGSQAAPTGPDRIAPLVDLLDGIYVLGLVRPIEEALRDLGNGALVADLLTLTPLLIDPDGLEDDSCAEDAEPADLEDIQAVALALLVGDSNGPALDKLSPLIDEVLAAEGTWTAMGNLGSLLNDGDARTRDLIALFVLLSESVDTPPIEDASGLVFSPSIYEPALRLLETAEVAAAIQRSETDQEGALPFACGLVLDDTLNHLLGFMANIFDMLGDMGG